MPLRLRPVVFAAVAVLAVSAAACSQRDPDPAKAAMRSAGGLSESRLPQGIMGTTPAPTGALPRDERLKRGWYKLASEGDKAPTYGDHPSY